MSDVENPNIPGHSPASMVGGMRVGRGHHPAGSSGQEQKLQRVPKHQIEEFVETNW